MEFGRQRPQRALFNPLALWGEWIGSMHSRGLLQFAEASKSQQFGHYYGFFPQAIKALGPPAFVTLSRLSSMAGRFRYKSR